MLEIFRDLRADEIRRLAMIVDILSAQDIAAS